MFSIDLDHLNVLIMLILAFFSFRAYNRNTLAIQYEEEVKVDEERKEEDVRMQEEGEIRDGAPQLVEGVEGSQIPVETEVAQDVEQTTIIAIEENIIIATQQPTSHHQLTPSAHKPTSTLTVESPSHSRIDLPQKDDYQQQSTLINKLSHTFPQESICDQEEEDNAECSSSSDGSSSSSQGIFPDLDSEDGKGLARKEKRKMIQKARRKEKKHLRREEQNHLLNGQGEVVAVEIQ